MLAGLITQVDPIVGRIVGLIVDLIVDRIVDRKVDHIQGQMIIPDLTADQIQGHIVGIIADQINYVSQMSFHMKLL